MTILCGITLVTLAEDLSVSHPGIIITFYLENAAFDRSAQRSAQILKLLLEREPDREYFPELAKSLFIASSLNQEEAEKREFKSEGMQLKFVGIILYLGDYLRPRKGWRHGCGPKCRHGTMNIHYR